MAELIVTGGSVMFEDAVKKPVPDTEPQYFPTRRARAEITFMNEDAGSDNAGFDTVDQAVNLATAKVYEMLRLGDLPPSLVGTASPQAEPPTPRKRRTKAEMAAARAAEGSSSSETSVTSSDGGAQTSAGDEWDESPQGSAPSSDGDGNKTGSPADEDWGAEAEPTTVTDADLQSAVTKKNAELKDAPRIRRLIGQYVDPPKGLVDIPQGQRGLFLTKLGELKPGGKD